MSSAQTLSDCLEICDKTDNRTSTWRSFATISSGLCFFWGIQTSSYGSIAYFREDHFSGGRPVLGRQGPEGRDQLIVRKMLQRKAGLVPAFLFWGRRRGVGAPNKSRLSPEPGADSRKSGEALLPKRRVGSGESELNVLDEGALRLGEGAFTRIDHARPAFRQFEIQRQCFDLLQVADR